jgi:hypothetical protein
MKNITYQELAEYIAKMPAERRQDNVSVTAFSQLYPVTEIVVAEETDVLDKGHIILVTDA